MQCSGLDSSSSAYCVRLLHNLSREGRTIVCTIHQPAASVYEMFDHVYVLSAGQCIFQGSAINTVPFLSSVGLQCPQYHNPADFRKCPRKCWKVLNALKLLSAVLEVANGEYGNYNAEMAAAAVDDRWRLTGAAAAAAAAANSDTSCEASSETTAMLMQSTPSGKRMEQFSMEPTKQVVSRVESNDSRDVHPVPSEWAKFWVLVGRCHVHYYRDWVGFSNEEFVEKLKNTSLE